MNSGDGELISGVGGNEERAPTASTATNRRTQSSLQRESLDDKVLPIDIN